MDDPVPANRVSISAWPEGPAQPGEPTETVDLWIAELEADGWPPAADLPAAERERAEAILRPGGMGRWSAARWALRAVLGRYLGEEPAHVRLGAAPGGKPRLEVEPGRLRFNLSHSGALALIAVSAEHEVGVDLERTEPRRDFVALAERSFEPEAAAAVREAPDERRADLFYAAWTRHEARAKCAGTGIWSKGAAAAVATVSIAVGPGYAAALAVAAASAPRLHEWSIEPPRGRVRR